MQQIRPNNNQHSMCGFFSSCLHFFFFFCCKHPLIFIHMAHTLFILSLWSFKHSSFKSNVFFLQLNFNYRSLWANATEKVSIENRTYELNFVQPLNHLAIYLTFDEKKIYIRKQQSANQTQNDHIISKTHTTKSF